MKISQQNSEFFSNVYDVVRLIPEGKVTSYGSIANYLGAPRSSRMVCWAMNASHNLKDVPAHRVVNRNGLLTGKMHFNPPERMEQLLTNEGLNIENDKIRNFEDVFWDPMHELKL